MREPLIVCHFSTSNMPAVNLSIFCEFLSHFYPKYLSAVAMVTGMCRDERNVTMRATALCKYLSGYRELL